MELAEKIRMNEQNIWRALEDYTRHCDYDLEPVKNASSNFVHLLAEDNADSKDALRTLFRKSPVWNEELDAIVINGTRTRNPDVENIRRLVRLLFVYEVCNTVPEASKVEWFFAYDPDGDSPTLYEAGLETIKNIAPKAYAPGKKKSRVFRALCEQFGLWDETAGSEFQRRYARLADELNARQIDFKLFVSLNPAHFLTMSNPHQDDRGETLISCHSLNSDYSYKAGCVGYARDETSFIVFTVDDPSNPELLNNRKTSRQIFAYEPGGGVLLQSRMYDTNGGTRGVAEDSALYRDLIQREISMLEDKPNLWNTMPAYKNTHMARTGEGFGGYPDWIYLDFDCKICIRKDCAENPQPLEVGTYGLCFDCGEDISSEILCDYCDNRYVCEECGEQCREYDMYTVYNSRGEMIQVCEDCRDRYYTYCEYCCERVPNDEVMPFVDRYGCEGYVCQDHVDSLCYCEACANYVQPTRDDTCPNCGVCLSEPEEQETEATEEVPA